MNPKNRKNLPALLAVSALLLLGCDNTAQEEVPAPQEQVTEEPTELMTPSEGTVPTGTLPTDD